MPGALKNLGFTIRCIVSGILLLSAIAKLFAYENFAGAVARLLQQLGIGGSHEWLIAPSIAASVIVLEIIGAAILLFFPRAGAALYLVLILIFLFTVWNIVTIILDINSSCNCFGNVVAFSPVEMLLIDIIIIFLLSFVISKNQKKEIV